MQRVSKPYESLKICLESKVDGTQRKEEKGPRGLKEMEKVKQVSSIQPITRIRATPPVLLNSFSREGQTKSQVKCSTNISLTNNPNNNKNNRTNETEKIHTKENKENKENKGKGETMTETLDNIEQEINCDRGTGTISLYQMLGEGSYGSVYLATDKEGNKMAVKCIKIEAITGLPNILEASIMSTIRHPNLARSIRTYSDAKHLFILQELAHSDLSKYTRHNTSVKTGIKKIPFDLLRKWCFELAQAVSCLHGQGIVHADIKSNNVLLFFLTSNTDEKYLNVRLSDFTLAVKEWSPQCKWYHTVCTSTHRAPECFLGEGWDYPLDIWSLACTFYEIAYNTLLFPYQTDNFGKKVKKSLLRVKMLACIRDWSSKHPLGKQEYQDEKDSNQTGRDVSKNPVDFIKARSLPSGLGSDYDLFNDLLGRMLLPASKRINIQQVLQHPFFARSGLSKVSQYYTVSTSPKTIEEKELRRIERYVAMYTEDVSVGKLALELYSRCLSIKQLTEHIKAMACVFLAYKLFDLLEKISEKLASILTGGIENDNLLEAERIICNHLSYRLHKAASLV